MKLLQFCGGDMMWNIHSNLMVVTPLFTGSDVPIEVGLLLAHRSNFGQMPFLPPPMTHRGTSSSWTQAHWVHHLNHWAMAAPLWRERMKWKTICDRKIDSSNNKQYVKTACQNWRQDNHHHHHYYCYYLQDWCAEINAIHQWSYCFPKCT